MFPHVNYVIEVCEHNLRHSNANTLWLWKMDMQFLYACCFHTVFSVSIQISMVRLDDIWCVGWYFCIHWPMCFFDNTKLSWDFSVFYWWTNKPIANYISGINVLYTQSCMPKIQTLYKWMGLQNISRLVNHSTWFFRIILCSTHAWLLLYVIPSGLFIYLSNRTSMRPGYTSRLLGSWRQIELLSALSIFPFWRRFDRSHSEFFESGQISVIIGWIHVIKSSKFVADCDGFTIFYI